MKNLEWILGVLMFVVPACASPAFPQNQTRRPSLIRDTATAEGKEEADVEKEKILSPAMAEKSVKIGDFYFKRKNYEAAIQRYLEALEYQPDRIEAYEALGLAYEKNKEIPKAIDVFLDFIRKYPESPKVPEFRSKVASLEKKSG